ncbi:hypothetical protein PC120_g22845 [Phytophthora cactorum]|nr:hypothetical protein PC120_g22845 [Phytophthora cactorum]
MAMPADKVDKAKARVQAALAASYLSRSDYRSLLGRLRHVATCVRPARPFLQRLCQQERQLHRRQRVPLSAAMIADLIWWPRILESSQLNGVPLQYFHALPASTTILDMDASDTAFCALVPAARLALRYCFSDKERQLIEAMKTDPSIGFDINYRELLSCAFAVHAWDICGRSLPAIALSSPFTSNFELTTCPRSRGRISWHRVTLVHRPSSVAQLLGSDVEASVLVHPRGGGRQPDR